MHLLVTALCALCAVSATATLLDGESNAQRLARGLPPRSPRFGRTLPGFVQARDDPTPAFGAMRPRPSSIPVTYTGKIEVHAYDGGVLGDVKNWASLPHINGINDGFFGEDLHVTFTTSGSAPFNILITNPTFPAPFYVGIGSSAKSLDLGSPTTVDMINVEKTPAGVPASGVETESAVWSFDRHTNELTVQYVNPDGSLPETVIAYDIRENKLFFVGDLDAYNFENDTPASPVTFFLVPI